MEDLTSIRDLITREDLSNKMNKDSYKINGEQDKINEDLNKIRMTFQSRLQIKSDIKHSIR